MRTLTDAAVLLVLGVAALTFEVTPVDADTTAAGSEPIPRPALASVLPTETTGFDTLQVPHAVPVRLAATDRLPLDTYRNAPSGTPCGGLAIEAQRVEALPSIEVAVGEHRMVIQLDDARETVRRYCDQFQALMEQFPGDLESPRIRC
ncbi:MAG: hypothetical protein OEV00_00660 [Acidobacteriota bacterium]|nr:hypothetical protein [Acidobacteriota bacterium]MDH3783815.1 hypothetical protein [Acidobacteriota bacterium]